MMLRLILVVLLIGFVSGIDVEMDCPNEVFVDEDFECEVEVSDGEARYDLKVEVDKERDSVLRIFCEERGWISGYYYLTDFIRDDEVVLLKVLEEGRYDVVLKLRDGDWREEFNVGKLKVKEGKEVEREEIYPRIGINDTNPTGRTVDIIVLGREDYIIELNDDEVKKEIVDEKWDYVSKDGMVIDWLPYMFCLFLIFLVGVLVWNRARKY